MDGWTADSFNFYVFGTIRLTIDISVFLMVKTNSLLFRTSCLRSALRTNSSL